MASSTDWGSSKEWDIDREAESLNKDLFGGKKKNHLALTPDKDLDKSLQGGNSDDDDEQFSKKALKRLKRKMKKLKKKHSESTDSDKNNDMKGEKNPKAEGEKNFNREGSSNKKKKNALGKQDKTQDAGVEINGQFIEDKSKKIQRIKEKPGKSIAQDSDVSLKGDIKKKKRKRKDSENLNEDHNVDQKKRKVVTGKSDNHENGTDHVGKRKRRRNRKKKNNSKKNKYKHLALNAKNKVDPETKGPDTIENNTSNDLEKEKAGQKIKQFEASSTTSQKKGHLEESGKKSKNLTDVTKADLSSSHVSNSQEDFDVKSKLGAKKQKREGDGKVPNKLEKRKLLEMLNSSDQSPNSSAKKQKKKGKSKNKELLEDKSTIALDKSISEHSTTLPASGSCVNSLDSVSDKGRGFPLSNSAKQLKDKATEKLNAARFRFINEQLYTCKGHDALQLFRKDQEAFMIYHQGFQSQSAKWPRNPLDAIIKQINSRPKQLVIADFGCGEAKLSQSVKQKVHSFDLVALNNRVTACDMSKTPLSDDSVDIAVFCLSLMGTNLNDYALEANRVLKEGGLLKIAEVASRFHSQEQFIKQISTMGFQLLNRRELSEMFYLMDFKKTKRIKKSPLHTDLKLKPCIYKRR